MSDTQSVVPVVDGSGDDISSFVIGQGSTFASQVGLRYNSAFVAPGNPLGVADAAVLAAIQAAAAQITPIAPSGALTLATAATAQSLAASVAKGGWLYNPASAAQQNTGSPESAWVNFSGGTATMTAGGQNFEVLPGATFPLPPTTEAVSWIAATAGHQITVVVW